jgi:hypothetical protein
MSLKSLIFRSRAQRGASTRLSILVCSSVVLGACGLGEIVGPLGPNGGALDSDNDGVPNDVDPNPNVAKPGDKEAAGITGTSSTSPGGTVIGSTHADLSFSCNADARASKVLQRLSRTEYENALRDVITSSSSAATATSVLQSVQAALDSYPADAISKTAPFASMDQSVSQAHADALIAIGGAVGSALTSSSARLGELLGSCAGSAKTSAATGTCVDDFIARFGKRALRHDLNKDERSFYHDVYGSSSVTPDAAALADVVTVMLNAPDFIYRVEYGKDAVAGTSSLFKLNDYEIATRLAFQFWQTTPDDALLAAADRGELSTEAGYASALDRVLSDARAGQGLETFAREWLGLDDLRALDSLNGTPVFDAFSGADKPSATLKEEMIQDVTDSIAYHAMKEEGSLADWIESPYSFAKSPALAALYSTPAWDGKSQPPMFPQGERSGLVTRAALLSTGSANTRPIMKGVLIRERLLCDKLGAPPQNAFGKLPDLSGEKTTRELVEAVTQDPQSNCAGCHTTQINPLGFATEGFDSLGRVRKAQELYDDNGKVVASKAVDTTSIPRVWLNDTTPSSGHKDLTNKLIESGKVEACFAREYVRYSEARAESEDTDGCELEAVRSTLENGSIKEALKRFAMLPQFRQRLVGST